MGNGYVDSYDVPSEETQENRDKIKQKNTKKLKIENKIFHKNRYPLNKLNAIFESYVSQKIVQISVNHIEELYNILYGNFIKYLCKNCISLICLKKSI